MRSKRRSGYEKSTMRLLLAVLLVAALATTVFANAVEPPGMVIYVPNAPRDLELTVEKTDHWSAERLDGLWDCYYRTYGTSVGRGDLVLQVQTGGTSFEVSIPRDATLGYCNLLTLDLQKQTLTVGEPWWRQPLLIGLRVLLTLVLEAAVLWCFGYRSKRSWVVFLVVNLLTQASLNIYVLDAVLYGSYSWTYAYVLMEAVIFLTEAVVFSLLLKEKKRRRGVACALAANGVSMAVGGMIICLLPV